MTKKINRRSLLGGGLAGLSLAATAPHFLGLTSRVFAAEGEASDKILVVLQLSGGNDGLSTVVPYGHAAYYANRQRTGIPEGEVRVLRPDRSLAERLAGASNEKYGQDQKAADYEADEIVEFRPNVALAWNVLYEDATRWRL